MRGTQRRHRIIAASADEAWAVVRRADLLHLWFPGIDSCTVEGDVRTIVTGVGLPIPEQILACDDIQRRFQYRITAPLFREHLGTIDVLPLDEASCLVIYSSDVEPAALALVLGGATQGALDELARQLEAGAGPAVDAVRPSPDPAEEVA